MFRDKKRGDVPKRGWVSSPVQYREGLNQEFRGLIELGSFGSEAPEDTDLDLIEGLAPRSRSQGFCIELKAVGSSGRGEIK